MIKNNYKHIIIKESEWNNNKYLSIDKIKKIINMTFQEYSEHIEYFTEFNI